MIYWYFYNCIKLRMLALPVRNVKITIRWMLKLVEIQLMSWRNKCMEQQIRIYVCMYNIGLQWNEWKPSFSLSSLFVLRFVEVWITTLYPICRLPMMSNYWLSFVVKVEWSVLLSVFERYLCNRHEMYDQNECSLRSRTWFTRLEISWNDRSGRCPNYWWILMTS